MSGLSEFTPSKKAAVQAQKALDNLSSAMIVKSKLKEIEFAVRTKKAKIPVELLKLFFEFLHLVAQGKTVILVPGDKILTTQEAADILNVSRPYVVKLLDDGKIPFQKVGAHRRIRAQDLFSYQMTQEQESEAAMNELSKLSQEMGLYNVANGK